VTGVLRPNAEAQLAEAKSLLAELRDALARFGAPAEDQELLSSSIAQLDELFLLVVVGEFNAGKSAFINALVGQTILDEGVTPTTARIHLLKYGERIARNPTSDGFVVVMSPIDLLRDVHIVDTPGTNAVIREHERLTSEFVPRSDLVFFVTSADRPFTETERAFLQVIRDWGKKIVIVVNKADIFENDADVVQVVTFIRDAARTLLGITPEIFAVSARLAQRAKHGEPALWTASRFEPLERFVRESLDEEERFRLKLANPIGVAQALAGRYGSVAQERLALLARDVSLLDDIEGQLDVYRADLARGFELRMAAIEKVLIDMEARGHRYFEDTLRIGRVMDLLNRARVQKEFEDQVVADAPRQVEQGVTELIDWLIDQDFRQWQAVTTRLADRTAEHGGRVIGAPEVGTFHAERARLITSVGGGAQRVVDTYDRKREAEAIADQARVAVTTAAAVGAGAVGLGTLVTVAATTAAADVTGILMAGVVAAIGFLVIPARRRRAKAEMREKLSALRGRLSEALRAEFERALARSIEHIGDAVGPYRRFVVAEQTRWRNAQITLAAIRGRATALAERLAAPSVITRGH